MTSWDAHSEDTQQHLSFVLFMGEAQGVTYFTPVKCRMVLTHLCCVFPA